jgi:FkbM family methyltransferase
MSDLEKVLALSHAGFSLKFCAPSPIIRSNIERLLTREPTTLPWIRSFEPREIFVDVGANIGLYSIYASVVAGARVYSFEPEAQNYAELNKNIFINGLHETVTAYCVALTDHSALANLYLCTFAVGFGHHDFGANSWEADLRRGDVIFPKDNRLTQGAVGMTLDELVESGAIPIPNHLKIDVDGFEWKVLAGAVRTLLRPEVKSVLIETDFSNSKCVETIQFMTEWGWRYSEKQPLVFEGEIIGIEELNKRISMRTGQQNFIYFRDQSKYDRIFSDFAEGYARQLSKGPA